MPHNSGSAKLQLGIFRLLLPEKMVQQVHLKPHQITEKLTILNSSPINATT